MDGVRGVPDHLKNDGVLTFMNALLPELLVVVLDYYRSNARQIHIPRTMLGGGYLMDGAARLWGFNSSQHII